MARLRHAHPVAGALGLAALAGALVVLELSARPALGGATAWIEEDRSGAAPAPLVLDGVRWSLEGAAGASATLTAQRLELVAPRFGALALNVRRRPLLRDVHLALNGPDGQRTDIAALAARVDGDQVALEGDVVARGPRGRELRTRALVWRRNEGRLIAAGPLSHTGEDRRPKVLSGASTDLALETTQGGSGAVESSDSEDELAASVEPAPPDRGAGAPGGRLQQQ